MRIVVDLQGAQTAKSHHPDASEPTCALILALLREGPEHVFILALNGGTTSALSNTVAPLRELFKDLLPLQNIVVWQPGRSSSNARHHDTNQHLAAQLTYEAFLLSHQPDLILITNLFAGQGNQAVTSIGRYQNTVPVIALFHGAPTNIDAKSDRLDSVGNTGYQDRLTDLRRANFLLSLSSVAYQQAIDELAIDESQIINLSIDADAETNPLTKPARIKLAGTALATMSHVVAEYAQRARQDLESNAKDQTNKPKLAYFSPLPGAQSGIAYYSAMLLPSLTAYYDITVILAQQEPTTDPWIQTHLPLRSLDWFAEHFDEFDRVVYQFGNSTFHRHMFEWLTKVPGVVVLHDFFLSGILADSEAHNHVPHAWTRGLYDSHGYQAVAQRFRNTDVFQTIYQYPANLSVLQQAIGVIVHTEHACNLARHWYGTGAADQWRVVPLVKMPPEKTNKSSAKAKLGLQEADLLVCSFGAVIATKQHRAILSAWNKSVLAQNPHAHLVFVGATVEDDYGADMQMSVNTHAAPSKVRITGWVDTARYDDYLQAADIGIQLRTHSRGETSGAALDCLAHGLPTIVNAHGSMNELDPSTVKVISDEFAIQELVDAINELANSPALRHLMGERAAALVRKQHHPKRCAQDYFEAIEHFYRDKRTQRHQVCSAIAKLNLDEDALITAADGIAKSFAPTPRPQRCLIDVSHLLLKRFAYLRQSTRDQVLEVLNRWQASIPSHYRIELIYTQANETHWRYAQTTTCWALEIPGHWAIDDIVQPRPGDMVVLFESDWATLAAREALLQDWRNQTNHLWLALDAHSRFEQTETLATKQKHESTLGLFSDQLSNQFNGLICRTPNQLARVKTRLNQSLSAQPNRANSTVLTLLKDIGACMTSS